MSRKADQSEWKKDPTLEERGRVKRRRNKRARQQDKELCQSWLNTPLEEIRSLL